MQYRELLFLLGRDLSARLPINTGVPRQGSSWSLLWQCEQHALVLPGELLCTLRADSGSETLTMLAPAPGRLYIHVPSGRFLAPHTLVGEVAWGAEFAAFIAAETARQQAEAERRLLPPPASLQSEREHLATLAVRVEAEVTSLRERLAAAEAKRAPEHDADEVGAAYTQLHDALHERAGASLSLAERAFLLEIEGAVRAALEAAGHLAPEPPLSPEVVITLSPAQRRAHTQIVGATGRGKSVLVEYLIRQDLEDTSAGVCLIDPHGQTYHELVSYLAHFRPELAERVILFDPSDQSEAVLGFNPIGPHALESPLFALNSVLVGILRSWGQGSLELTPRIVRWLENIFTVIIANRLTLVESLPLISAARDLSERTQLLSKLNVEIVRQDWEEYDQATSTQRHAYIEGAHNRLRKLLRNPHLRNMFGVQARTLDMERVIREKKILLVNLAPNRNIDLEDMRLIGILLIHEIFRAAMHRDPNANPAPFYLYIDEFSQFVTDDIAYMLEQCRKFGLFVTLIHQQLAQLRRDSEYLFASVLTNCQNRIAFGGLSAEDSELMVKELHSGFEQFHEVKYRTETTKFRPIEVLRSTYTVGSSHTDAATAAFLHGLSAATSVGRTLSKGIQQSETTSEAQVRGRSETRTHAIAEALSQARMHHRSRGTGQGQATGLTASESHTDSASHTTGASLGSSEGEATALGMGVHTGVSTG